MSFVDTPHDPIYDKETNWTAFYGIGKNRTNLIFFIIEFHLTLFHYSTVPKFLPKNERQLIEVLKNSVFYVIVISFF